MRTGREPRNGSFPSCATLHPSDEQEVLGAPEGAMERPRAPNFCTLELVADDESADDALAIVPRQPRREGLASRRFRQLRDARLRRAKLNEVSEEERERLLRYKEMAKRSRMRSKVEARLSSSSCLDREQPRPPSALQQEEKQQQQRRARQPPARVKQVQTQAQTQAAEQACKRRLPSMSSEDLEAFLSSFETRDEEDLRASLLDSLGPDSTLYRFAAGAEQARSDSQSPTGVVADEDGSFGGVFGLTDLGTIPDGPSPYKQVTGSQSRECDADSTGTHESQLVVKPDRFDAEGGQGGRLGPMGPFSKLGKATAQMCSRQARRRLPLRAGVSGEAPPAVQRLGRCAHLRDCVELLHLEMDAVKFVSVREDILDKAREVHSALLQAVSMAREHHLQRSTRKKRPLALAQGESRIIAPGEVMRTSTNATVIVPPVAVSSGNSTRALSINLGSGINSAVENQRSGQDMLASLDTALKSARSMPSSESEEDRAAGARKQLQEDRANIIKAQVVRLQEELAREIDRLRGASVDAVRAILAWRACAHRTEEKRFLPRSMPEFTFKGGNYLLVMSRDLAFLGGGAACDPEDDPDGEAPFLDPGDVESPKQLVEKWLGCQVAGNPLLLRESKSGTLQASLVAHCEAQDLQQARSAEGSMKDRIRFGLTTGQSAKDIFESPCEPNAAPDGGGAGGTGRISPPPALSSERHTERPLSPLSARGYDMAAEAAVARPDTARAAPTPKANQITTTMTVTVPRFPALPRSKTGGIQDTVEYALRRFDLTLQPSQPLVRELAESATSAPSLEAARAILGEQLLLDQHKIKLHEENERRAAAYDPLANVKVRGGAHEVLGKSIERVKADAPARVQALRRRQTEGKPDLALDDPVGGACGQPLGVSAGPGPAGTRKGPLVATTKLSAKSLKRTQQERAVVGVSKTHLLNRGGGGYGGTVRFTHLLRHGNDRRQQQLKLAKINRELEAIRRQTHRAGGVMADPDKTRVRELEMQAQVLRAGFLPSPTDGDSLSSGSTTDLFFHDDGGEPSARTDSGFDNEDQAATLVQSMYRMQQSKQLVAAMRAELENDDAELMSSIEELASVSIQTRFRGFRARKEAQLKEATMLMEREEERLRAERKRLELLKEVQMKELKDRGRKRRLEMAQEREQALREQALDAARKAEAAKVLSRHFRHCIARSEKSKRQASRAAVQIQARVRCTQAQSRLANRMLTTHKERAAIKIQAAARGMIERVFYRELQASEKKRMREEYARRRARERYARLYMAETASGSRAKASSMGADAHRLRSAVNTMLPVLAIHRQQRHSGASDTPIASAGQGSNPELAQEALKHLRLPDIGRLQNMLGVDTAETPRRRKKEAGSPRSARKRRGKKPRRR